MKVLVTGSREYKNRAAIKMALVAVRATVVIAGGARGTDKLAFAVAEELGIECREYLARWRQQGKVAGSIRNQEMLTREHLWDEPIDLVLAFPLKGSIGTFDMMMRAKRVGIPIIEEPWV